MAGSITRIDGIKAERLRADRLLNAAPVSIVACDEQQLITAFNAAAEKLTGHSAADMLGKPISKLLREEHLAQHTVLFDEAVARLREYPGDGQLVGAAVTCQLKTKDDKLIEIEIIVSGTKVSSQLEFIACMTPVVHRDKQIHSDAVVQPYRLSKELLR
jgi:two-component system sensor kinase FixL